MSGRGLKPYHLWPLISASSASSMCTKSVFLASHNMENHQTVLYYSPFLPKTMKIQNDRWERKRKHLPNPEEGDDTMAPGCCQCQVGFATLLLSVTFD